MSQDTRARSHQVNAPSSGVPPVIVRVGDKQWVIGDVPNSVAESGPEGTGESRFYPVFHTGGNIRAARRHVASRGGARLRLRAASRWVIRHLDRAAVRLVELLRPLLGQAAAKSRTGFRPRGATRRLRDSFQIGLTLGMVLGCLSLLWFHQLDPIRTVAEPAQPAANLADEPSGPGLTVPAIQVYGIQLASYSSRVEAETRVAALKGQTPAVVWPIPSGRYLIVAKVAVTSSALKKEVKGLENQGYSASVISLKAPVRTLTVRSSAAASASVVSHWLFAEVSALNALTAVLMDGGNEEDAAKACQTATALRPASDQLNMTDFGPQLQALAAKVDEAVQAWKGHRNTAAQKAVLEAYGILVNLGATN